MRTSKAILFSIFIVFIFSCETIDHHHTPKTADEAVKELIQGNERFVNNELLHQNFIDEAHFAEKDQHPHTFVLSCIDSRVPPEIVFDQGIGNLFVARVAGNIEDDNILGSMEYAVQVKGTKLLVVLGHSNCGAVQGAIDNVNLGHLTQLTNQIKVAFSKHKTYPLPEHLSNETGRLNVLSTIDHILSSSQIIRELVNKKKIKIVGTFYDLHTGKVELLQS
jgi:carbonic anhydrase